MKNTSIYKYLKIKNNTLEFKGTELYKFIEDDILDEYQITETINKLKRFIDNAMKTYIKYCEDYTITNNGHGHIVIDMECNQDGDKYNKTIEFVTFFKNQINYL
ncbi:hypothetical protein SAMN06313540_11218 [Epsilonproteobacteria bacterium SCGC AD-308-E02]|nr:hypothetical protein SAMN06313540_11218 [Epsilonproteobacteria bacterium SCGC AD-308-E02]